MRRQALWCSAGLRGKGDASCLQILCFVLLVFTFVGTPRAQLFKRYTAVHRLCVLLSFSHCSCLKFTHCPNCTVCHRSKHLVGLWSTPVHNIIAAQKSINLTVFPQKQTKSLSTFYQREAGANISASCKGVPYQNELTYVESTSAV